MTVIVITEFMYDPFCQVFGISQWKFSPVGCCWCSVFHFSSLLHSFIYLFILSFVQSSIHPSIQLIIHQTSIHLFIVDTSNLISLSNVENVKTILQQNIPEEPVLDNFCTMYNFLSRYMYFTKTHFQVQKLCKYSVSIIWIFAASLITIELYKIIKCRKAI